MFSELQSGEHEAADRCIGVSVQHRAGWRRDPKCAIPVNCEPLPFTNSLGVPDLPSTSGKLTLSGKTEQDVDHTGGQTEGWVEDGLQTTQSWLNVPSAARGPLSTRGLPLSVTGSQLGWVLASTVFCLLLPLMETLSKPRSRDTLDND